MENLENQSSSTFRSYSCFWPTIIVQLGILIKYCGSDFETDISFLSWLLSKLSESPIFWPWVEENRNLSGHHSKPTQLSEWWTAAHSHSPSRSLTDCWYIDSDESGNRTHSVVEKDEHLVPTQWAMSAGGHREKFTWIYCSVYHPVISRKIES